MKISFFEIKEGEKEVINKSITGHELSFFEEKLNDKTVELAKDSDIVSVFVNSELRKESIDSISKLKFISTRSTGFDHIDIAYAKSKGINVSNVPAYGSRTVAEFAFALLLDLSRKVREANNQLRNNFSYDISHLQGFDLCGKTLGVIGTGKIGKNVIKIAKGFDMKVIAFDAFPDQVFAKENGFEYLPLEEVLGKSDIVTLHTPYNKDTHHLINMETIKKFKKGAYLINTARGEIVDTKALLWGLNEGIIAGAGLDVLEEERKLKENVNPDSDKRVSGENIKTILEDRMLIDMPQVVVTPHIAFSSIEAESEIRKVTIENILGFIEGNSKNVVNK